MSRSPLLLCLLTACAAVAAADMDLDLRDAPVAQVLSRIQAEGDFGLVFSPDQLVDPDGRPLRVTITIEDIDPLPALQAVARAVGLLVENQGGEVYVVRPPQFVYCRCPHHRGRGHDQALVEPRIGDGSGAGVRETP